MLDVCFLVKPALININVCPKTSDSSDMWYGETACLSFGVPLLLLWVSSQPQRIYIEYLSFFVTLSLIYLQWWLGNTYFIVCITLLNYINCYRFRLIGSVYCLCVAGENKLEAFNIFAVCQFVNFLDIHRQIIGYIDQFYFLFLNDLPLILSHCSVWLYADDTIIYISKAHLTFLAVGKYISA